MDKNAFQAPRGLWATAYYGGLIYFLDPTLMRYQDQSKLERLNRIDRWNLEQVALRRPKQIKDLLAQLFPLFALPWEDGVRYRALESLSREWFAYERDDILKAFIRYHYGVLRSHHFKSAKDFIFSGCECADTQIEKWLASIMSAELAVTRGQSTRRHIRRYCRAHRLSIGKVWAEIMHSTAEKVA